MSQRIALIFGISGQDGAYLAHLLLSKGYQVHGVSRGVETGTFDRLIRIGIRDRIKLHTGNLGDFRSVVELIGKVRPDEIYNLAGQSSVALSFELPVETFDSVAVGTINILEYLRLLKHPVRLFQAVSTECFGNTQAVLDETGPFRPRSPYAVAKAASFWANSIYREAYGLHVCSGILSNHESPLRPLRFVTRKIVQTAIDIARGSKERLVLGNVGIERDWGWAPEYAEAMWCTLQHDEPDDYIIATGETRPLSDLVAAVFARLDLDWRDHVDTDETLFRPTELQRVELNPARARDRLGWTAQSKMADVVSHLVACALDETLGPVPWQQSDLPDYGALDPYLLSENRLRKPALRAVV
jgi:GDPmannose 4,6-dehydratase